MSEFRLRLSFSILLLASAHVLADTNMPAYVLELPVSVSDVFVADAGESTLYRFRHDDEGLTLAEESYVSIGQNGVGKQQAWDRKTPLGIYFVVDQLDTRRLHEKYGITAFPLDYPNVWDELKERTGYGIWIHGVLIGGGPRPPLDTDGCLALPNEKLRVLARRFVPLITPVIVARDLRWRSATELDALRDELRLAIAEWVDALAKNDLHAYLSLYSNEFRYRGMTLGEWASLRVQTLAERGVADVAIDELLLLADPEEEGLYLSRFRQRISVAEFESVTTKRLYWKRDDGGELKIVAEDNG